ncbi:GTP cyclohydrolase FolE2 [Frateuria aurantia]
MDMQTTPSRSLPDVALNPHPHRSGPLDWVGMGRMQMPVRFDAGNGQLREGVARVDAFVNLARSDKRGIHMSRLYLLVEQALGQDPVGPQRLEQLLQAFLSSHEGLSDRARVRIEFEQLIRRPALRSANSGWRAYPVVIEAELSGGHFSYELSTEVVYSSTCPASAALARQLIQDRFGQDFAEGEALDREAVLAWLGSEDGIMATPHAQRSIAEIKVRPQPGQVASLLSLLDRCEHALATPVQTAVKREDEQAFAAANGGNLMFCEDAARRLSAALSEDEAIADFRIRIEHQESLHPHDAVAYAFKGVVGGYDR